MLTINKWRPYVVLTPHLFLSFYLLTLLVFLFISRFYGLLLLDFSIAFSKISFSLAAFPQLMDENWAEGKRTLKCKEEDEEEEEEEEVSEMMGYGEDGRKRRMVTDLYSKRGSKAGGSVPPSCQVDSCKADLSDAKQYHRRHKVCEYHAKAPAVLIAEQQQRFCQQCSRFHELSEFDDSKRSCRRRLAGHNERRRKNAADYHGEGFH